MNVRAAENSGTGIATVLLEARRGTAYFSRILNGLTDADLAALTGTAPGETRAHIVARVSLHARKTAELLEAVRTGVPYRPRASAFDEDAVAFAATHNSSALRNLHAHSVVHLNVEWRDLPPQEWMTPVRTRSVEPSTPAALAAERRRVVWTSAHTLDPLARARPLPADLRP